MRRSAYRRSAEALQPHQLSVVGDVPEVNIRVCKLAGRGLYLRHEEKKHTSVSMCLLNHPDDTLTANTGQMGQIDDNSWPLCCCVQAGRMLGVYVVDHEKTVFKLLRGAALDKRLELEF